MSRKLRQEMRQQRRALDFTEQRRRSLMVSRLILKHLFFLRAKNIAFYMASDGELDPDNLLANASLMGKRCFLPVVTDALLRWHSAPLAFHAYEPGNEETVYNRFGIPEPSFDARRISKIELLDIIFMPLVAFDRSGARLGMGAGFYDRTLATMNRRFRRPRLVGLAHSFQEVAVLPTNEWDVPLDAIVTERELIRVR